MNKMSTNQDGMKAELICQKLVPSIQEAIKAGQTEKRQLVLKGNFLIFEKGRKDPTKLPASLEFKDEPGTVDLVQQVLNVYKVGEKCLLTLDSNKHGRLDEYLEELESKKQKQLDEYISDLPKEPDVIVDDEVSD